MITSADIHRQLITMVEFMYQECQKRSEHPDTAHIVEVVDSVLQLSKDDQFRGEAMQMAMMLISFGRLYQELGGQASLILKVAEEGEN